ncbi:MAG: sugar transferase [Deltaproteobacteria bacterium]|nr:sugar transferase [Deltaproteobacteria bacterium]
MVKRLADVHLSLVALVGAAPVMVLAAAAIKLTSKGPVLYRGVRAGKAGQPFEMLKFRTMVAAADRLGGPSTSDSDPRVTAVGAVLRRFKLDELPQLINVLRGEMSVVGPRPEVLRYVSRYTESERAILGVRPGITDWASIWNSAEGEVLSRFPDPDRAYEEVIRPTKLALQLKYVREMSALADLKIVVGTARKLLDRGWLPRELRAYGRLQDAEPLRGAE